MWNTRALLALLVVICLVSCTSGAPPLFRTETTSGQASVEAGAAHAREYNAITWARQLAAERGVIGQPTRVVAAALPLGGWRTYQRQWLGGPALPLAAASGPIGENITDETDVFIVALLGGVSFGNAKGVELPGATASPEWHHVLLVLHADTGAELEFLALDEETGNSFLPPGAVEIRRPEQENQFPIPHLGQWDRLQGSGSVAPPPPGAVATPTPQAADS